MVSFFNMFLSYLILVIISMAVIVAAVICGKKLREAKDARTNADEAAGETAPVQEEQ